MRTAGNSAGYLLPHLRTGLDRLDLGCGPGTITLDLAARGFARPRAGIDASCRSHREGSRPWARARPISRSSPSSPSVTPTRLDLPDASFDVVHAHQVLQYLSEPIAAVAEAARVLRPDGILAVRDSDYAGVLLGSGRTPASTGGSSCTTSSTAAQRGRGRRRPPPPRRGCAPGLQRRSRSPARHWTFADAAGRAWWGGLVGRPSATRRIAASRRCATACRTQPELCLDRGRAGGEWIDEPHGVFVVPSVEIIARR